MLDITCFLISFVLVNVCLMIATALSKTNIITSYTSRKIVHISLGVCEIVMWGCYSEEPTARIWGSMCCILYLFVFLIFGMGWIKGPIADFLIATVCRNGDYKEMLYGPLNYCCIMTFLSLLYWRNYPASIIGMMIMLTGDGMAEIIGKMIGKTQLKNPWGKTKTIEGAIAVMVCGAVGAMVMCYIIFGQIYFIQSIISGLVGAIVEFYSYPNYDNVFIPLSSLLLGFFIF
ncbi:phosphatidate cytidylyltransferase, putative [Entamoeba histolytica HM-1:IMSS-B]|uniref:Uncharacterized protein n=6 Tax=Entamoeba histolytica TaxID=5759 RepID=C4M0J1_ENTH1|nr:hypothetical protein, conserved [Entamoeba histolytica HM-1:IMSS]EMD45000.1 phosphatidate cytidylyltransferase, putative [Entamoeba histolytica KU27]EMH75772.1 phosphatidate cytidylyltransferase, putative [Entamoeba histolytica HM-1:IMSS-B]EMS11032.1 phosphatidate cytidylyltransferase, putative [Entamoeba histolytica HM-3:IMSS]ENY64997.1 phosphatidate cytidylyltransferase, putative [Entamoeba histolytica HM-1:IMSS-A]BAN39870.1 phosphatidate cytidylyltransferase, putative [Entamoeba histolyt|eukprot:XP_650979.1 hypothetical protein, conserved [Entamoeba histolytica HM-1:IMSS]